MWRHLSKIILSKSQQRNFHNLSYAFCPSNETLVSACVSDLIDYNGANFPDKIAVISHHQNLVKTYGQLEQDVNQLAKALKHLGCKKGDRIGIWAPNCYEWVVVQYATSKIGAISTFINPGYRARELSYCLNLVNCHTIISSQKVKASNYYEILHEVIPSLKGFKETKNIEIPKMPFLKNIVMINHREEPAPKNFLRFNDLMKLEIKDQLDTSENQFDDITNIQFTSGTTGHPKGAALSHFNIVNNSKIYHKRCYEGMPNENHKICLQVPLYHAFGSVGGSLIAMHSQSAMIFPSETFEPVASLKAIQKYKCDMIYGTPTMFVDVLTALDKSKYELSSLVRGVMSGANCPIELLNQVKAKIPSVNFISIPYGATELSPVVTSTSIHDTIKQQTETVGRPLDYTEIKVVDPLTGKIQPTGQPGEVLTRGYSTFIGYWNQEERTKEVIDKARWYKTGDIGVMDKDGYLSITGRIKEMIIRGGENIFPREIEEYLLTNPSIIDVHVVGVPDKRMGEEMCAFVRLKSNQIETTEKELKDFCKGKISHFKIPKYFEFVEDVPRTVTGKVQKYILKEIAAKKYQNN